MGTFKVAFQIGSITGDRWEWVEALVDTGATYSLVPGAVLRSLGVEPMSRFPFVLADGTRIDQDVAEARVRLNGDERTTLVIFGSERTEPILGAYTLEGFLLGVDPAGQRLISVPGLLM